ncbi:MAG: response regulator [Acidimicrobiia bacterium]|nr:response regulator [Acidimicrobiia bacterium]
MNFRGAAVTKTVTSQSKIKMREVVSAARLGQKDLARTHLKELLGEDPDNEQALLWAAALALTPEEASLHLERVLSVNPNNQQAINILAVSRLSGVISRPQPMTSPVSAPIPHFEPEPVVEARPAPPAAPAGRVLEFREMLKRNWACPLCHGEAMQPQRRCGRCGALLALEDLQALAENRGVDEKLLAEAVGILEKRATVEPTSDACVNVARVYLNLNRSAEAMPWLKKALDANPNDTGLKLVVRQLESRQLVLAVDDSTTLRKILSIMLERKGYRVLTAGDGMQALARLDEQVPDLILLDITMPRMDGYQVCKVIKQNPYTKNIPVVMLSGNDGFFDKVKGKLAGAADYVTKPFEDEQLTKAVKKYIRAAQPKS